MCDLMKKTGLCQGFFGLSKKNSD